MQKNGGMKKLKSERNKKLQNDRKRNNERKLKKIKH